MSDLTLKQYQQNISLLGQETVNAEFFSEETNVELVNEKQDLILVVAGAIAQTTLVPGGTYVANYNEVFPADFINIPTGQTLDKITISIEAAFNGTGASLKIGTSLDDDRFISTTEVELSTAGLTFEKDLKDDGPLTLRLTIAPGSGASQGQVKIQISTTKTGV